MASQPVPDPLGDPTISLVMSIRNGQVASIDELLRICRGYLYLVANRELAPVVRGRVSPSDVVQEACTRIYRSIDRFRGDTEAELLGWMSRIVSNCCREVERNQIGVAKRDVTREVPVPDGTFLRGVLPRTLKDDRTPSGEAIQNETENRIAEALAEMPEDHREVIRLRQWDRWEFSEIAQAMDRTEAAVRKLWFRAVRQLGQRLQEMLGDEFERQ